LDSSCASANFRGGRKKKVIAEADGDESEGNRSIQFQSIFKTVEKGKKKAPDELPPLLMPPEGSIDPMDDELSAELSSASQWDIATRYHEFKARPSMQALTKKLRKLSAEAILERAREVLGSVVHPVEQRSAPWTEVPAHADQPEVDLEETIENSPLGVTSHDLEPQDIWMEYNVHRKQPIVLSVDTSLSMTGEKLALTAVALAVVLIQFPDDPVGIVAFEKISGCSGAGIHTSRGRDESFFKARAFSARLPWGKWCAVDCFVNRRKIYGRERSRLFGYPLPASRCFKDG
jgi:hypothetical protein